MSILPAPKKYPDELRQRAVRLVMDAQKNPNDRRGACTRIGSQLGIPADTIRGWVRTAEIDQGLRPGTTTDDATRLAELEREVAELRRANAILKSASGFLRGGARPPIKTMIAFIDQHKEEFGVEPICKQLPIAPSTYYAAKARPESKRAVSDAVTTEKIKEVHKDNYSVYGARKVYAALNRAGHKVARCTVERLMRREGLHGVRRAKGPRTTVPGPLAERPADLVKRQFTAPAPNCLWVVDITYIRTFSGWVYAAFVLDVFSRRVVGWQLSTTMHTALALDALEMGLWTRHRDRKDVSQLVHHSDRGVQYRAIRYTERLAEAEAVASVGAKGDSYDNAMAEALNSLFKAELVRNKGPWTGINDLEIAVAEYFDWYNHRRLHGEIGYIPPVEAEVNYYVNLPALKTMERV
ncbi:IS3 family transposase [Arthrobacter sp. STN4]|uniref:IS3 family transposase n=1 Tax=Arthrobacter sp. STN4 TaxID=2923276 RepID=UPI002119DA33|nr:IS3 family transposase [Arthrobacter sp. STN4]MCQ9163970.1 IS3 family transposase [Arthrobacter sp. STN4]